MSGTGPLRACQDGVPQCPGKRRLLVGQTDGGQVLTLVVERTVDPTTWLIVPSLLRDADRSVA